MALIIPRCVSASIVPSGLGLGRGSRLWREEGVGRILKKRDLEDAGGDLEGLVEAADPGAAAGPCAAADPGAEELAAA